MSKSTAIVFILFGAFFMSFNGVLIKLIEGANGFQILFYRSITLSLTVILVSCVKRKISIIKFLSHFDRWDFAIGACLGIAFTTYVFSIMHTSVAATLFILATSPLIASFLSWFFMGEKPSLECSLATFFALLGVFLMIHEGLKLDRTLGNILALIAACSFASMLFLTRLSTKKDVLNGTFVGGVLSGAFGVFMCIIFDSGFQVSFVDLTLILIMGAFAIGIGITLVSWGAPFIPASEVSVIVLLESLLGPIWVWIFLNQPMSSYEIFGGFLILLSVGGLSYFGSINKQ